MENAHLQGGGNSMHQHASRRTCSEAVCLVDPRKRPEVCRNSCWWAPTLLYLYLCLAVQCCRLAALGPNSLGFRF